MVQSCRVLPEPYQDIRDRIAGACQRRGTGNRTGEWIETRRNARKRSNLGLYESRRTARLVLLGIVAHKAEADVLARLEQRLCANQITITIVHVGIVDHVVVETVALEKYPVDPRGNRFAKGGIDPAFDTDGVIIAIGEIGIAAEIEFGFGSVDRNQACRCVTTTERALRATQDFDPIERPEFGKRVARTRTIHAVHEDGDRAFEARVVAHRANTADTGGTVRFVTGRGNEQRRRDLVEFANIAGAGVFQRLGRYGRNRDRDIGEVLCAALCGNDDHGRTVIHVGIIDQVAFFGDFLCHCCLRQQSETCAENGERAQ